VTVRRLAGIVFVASFLASCASGGARIGQTADTDELESLYRARQDSALTRFDPADVEFVTGMIAHHGQAIVMAEMTPTRARSDAVRTLSARIVNAQQDEIALMERWLRDRAQPVPGAGVHDHGPMPGMLTPDELDELSRSNGEAYDRLFLSYMIRHHRGAVAMVDALLAADRAVQAPATFDLASDIHVDQSTEIARMEQLLAQLSVSPTNGAAR
jgi:uncharacterized protein (DUF305 family)